MRAAIIHNDTANASLMSGTGEQGHRPASALSPTVEILQADGTAKPTIRTPTVVYMPTYNELQAIYNKQSAKMQASITNQFAQWLEDPQQYAKLPDKSDFPKFKRILRDPDNPSAGYFSVLDTNPDGSAKVDETAYKAAMIAYTGGKPGGNKLADDARSMMLDKFGRLNVGKTPRPIPSLVPAQLNDPIGSTERNVFGTVERDLANAANGGLASPPNARSPSSSGDSHSAQTSVLSSGRTYGVAGGPTPTGPLTGNDPILQPKGTTQNQNDSYTVRLPLNAVHSNLMYQIETDVGDAPDTVKPAVELPPGPMDE